MSPKDDLAQLAKQEGCLIEESKSDIRLLGLRGLAGDGSTVLCDLRKSFLGGGPQAGNAEGALHAIAIYTRDHGNPWLHEANGMVIGNQLGAADDGWHHISLGSTTGQQETARELLARYGKHIVGAVAAKEAGLVNSGAKTLIQIAAESYEIRANLRKVQESIRDQAVAIIGLGGTGSYIFDILTRTPVRRIVLIDNDDMQLKNLMRSPGGLEIQRMTNIHHTRVKKVHYYQHSYKEMEKEIIPRAEDANAETGALLKELGVEFAFVAVGQTTGTEQGRPDDIYVGLENAGIQFIDTGISLRLQEGQLTGGIRTTRCHAGSASWKRDIPNVGLKGAEDLYHNIQVPELNSLAAIMAILEWRRMTSQYQDETNGARVSKYDIERNQTLLGGM